ncbi:zinc-binding alcohol dehydrogenase family protein [Synoicihabitans lomoniglobus]|uniref:Zinc-binding alcohol dehydrogenase family protein n=1 Tax=Synoicihabitans lomoniglobus TaxID=2909285 RepID=A0AAE9ZU52_9BACT|nr:zinc-binding alcohol dehydrogenase family protein [Opitutaceae bacterium LMO-M01]WED63114.1 zinc-binding alcohol dehydrogenase family protein [Opitutaceae bacterium LMO-M01]
MQALSLLEPGILRTVTVPDTLAPGPGEVLIRVHRVGVCGTDLHAFKGHQPFFNYPRILGHELGVEVLTIGADVTNVAPGDRCAVEPYLNCGRCIACRCGKPNCCTDLNVLGVHIDGGHREQLVVPAAKLHPSRTLSFDQLALVETLGIGAHAVERAALVPGESVAVIGTGPIGLSVIQFALAAEARVIALDINAPRLAFCRERLGLVADDLIHTPGITDVAARLAALTDGDMPTAVFDATGNPASMAAAFSYPAHGGRLIFVGLFRGDVSFHDPDFHRRELTLMSSRNARPDDFRRILKLIESGRIDTTPWITHRAHLTAVPDHFPTWADPATGVLKAMISL